MLTAAAGTTVLTTATDVMDSRIVRLAVSKFRTNKVVPRQGELFAAFFHPDCTHDLRSETGTAAWRDPHNFSGAESVWAGNTGVYEGAYFIESPRVPFALDGASGAKVYRNFFMGREALAEAVAEEFSIKQGPVVDKLGRFTPWGYYGVMGWNRFREDALIRAEVSSSIA
jgi:N4-gp56 family major capsid protein